MSNIPDIGLCIEANVKQYFHDLDGETPCNVYEMVLQQIEQPLLKTVMAQCNGKQSKAAEVLGLNRNTLRKKLLKYDLID